MKDYMKTIISSIQNWVLGKIKNSTADWNQNDETVPDYVKNRPFYDYNVVEHVMLDNAELQFEEGCCWFEFEADISGRTYVGLKIIFDGVEYFKELNTPYNWWYDIGNAHLMFDEYEDTGEPYYCNLFIDYEGGGGFEFYTSQNINGTHTITIVGTYCDAKSIKYRHLPDGVLTFMNTHDQPLNTNTISIYDNDYADNIDDFDYVPEWQVYISDNRLFVKVPDNYLRSYDYHYSFYTNINLDEKPVTIGEFTSYAIHAAAFQEIYFRNMSIADISASIRPLYNNDFRIPAQISFINDKVVVKGQYIDDKNKVYIIEMQQISEFNNDGFCNILHKITRIM